MSLTFLYKFAHVIILFFNFIFIFAKKFRLVQIKTILANSTFNINEIVNKTTSDDDEDDNADKSSDVEDDDEYNGSDDFFEFHEDSDLKNVYV